MTIRTLTFSLGLCTCLTASAADQVLFRFNGPLDSLKVTTSDAQVAPASSGKPGLRIATGHQQAWPGITLPAPAGKWDISSATQVKVTVRNVENDPVTVFCRVDNPGADGSKHCVTGSVQVKPGETRQLTVDLNRSEGDRLGGKLFGMRGYPAGTAGDWGIDAANVTGLLIFLDHPNKDHSFEVQEICATGNYVAPTANVADAKPFFPFIDTFGQYKHKDWPGKVKSMADLAEKRAAEAKELTSQPGPMDWDKFGGWTAGPQLKATGFFRTEKYKGKWWLVDPEGRLFFSQGIDCIPGLDSTPIEERQTWFEDFPGSQPEFKPFFSKNFALHGHYSGRTVESFSFSSVNLFRKYGADWKTVYPTIVHQRLRSWGINTVANWSDLKIGCMHQTPYTDTIGSWSTKMIEGSEGYWGKFPDVFDPSFAAALQKAMANKTSSSANDPWCIGYFSDNEMSWGDDISLAMAALKSPPEQAAKQAFIADLKAKYGEIAKLNEAWGTQHASWDALRDNRTAPDKDKARADLQAFYSKAAEQYFKGVRDAIKAVAPQQLYLGCRFAWVNERAARASAKYCDVVSYNIYKHGVADFHFNGDADVPLIIGEFHFGALDRGMFHTGLVPVSDQNGRAQAYKDYVLGAVNQPQFVGTHWFQWRDEPTTGRSYDEENYQIGFVDVADTPYPEIVAASREVAATMYKTRLGK